MGGKDWKAEARRLLEGAVGGNDNAPEAALQQGAGIHFHGPVTVNLMGECPQPSAGTQRRALQDRLKGFLQAEGTRTAAAFREELQRTYRKADVDELTNPELADLLANFQKLIRLARLLGATAKR